ncbi:MAG TPA: gluconokinase [Methylomirabilota bacterium]|nr:gluconokinase [Methylomirabilota bacterium]
MLVLALDVGTSSARARVFDEAGRTQAGAEGQVTYEPSTTPDGGVELDADALLAAVTSALDASLAGCGARAAEIAAVGASVFWHSLLALDGAGRPLTPVITWADTRSAPAAAALRGAHDERRAHARTGAPLHSAFFPAKLRWLRESRPDVWARAAIWCGFGEYLHARLTGHLAASLSMASGTGLLDQIAGGWDADMLAVSRITAAQLPPIDDSAAPGLTAEYAARWPILARVPWHPARGDGACSNVGSDCRGPRQVALNLGTSAALRVILPEPLGPHATTPWGLWRYRVDARRALVGGATSEGGNVLAWCRRHLALPGDPAALEAAIAAAEPDRHGLTALPFLAGERSPGWRPEARAAVTGISLGTGAIEITRALLESVAFRLAEVYDRLRPLAAADHVVVASGGALTHSPAWAQIVTDALGVPVGQGGDPEASARGAALLALEALGVVVPGAPAPLRVLQPAPERHARYRAARERQRLLYDNIVGINQS